MKLILKLAVLSLLAVPALAHARPAKAAAGPAVAAASAAGPASAETGRHWLSQELRGWLIKIGLAVLFTLAMLLGWRLLRDGSAKFGPFLEDWVRRHTPGIKLQRLELISSRRLANLILRASRALSFVPYLLLIWIYSVVIFAIFPGTKGLSMWILAHMAALLGRVVEGVAGSIPNLIFVAVVAVCTHYALRLARVVFLAIEEGRLVFSGFHPEWAMPTFQIVRFLAWAFALVVAFPYLPGSNSPAFKGVSVFLGVLLSLGSSSAVANAVAGIILTYMRPFKVGDRVQIGDNVGDVVEKSLLVTRLRTIKNLDVTIGYDAPWPRVHELLAAAARQTPGIQAEPAPFVLQTQLGDFNVSYQLNAYTQDAADMANIYSRLHENIQNQFQAGGVEIMSPRYLALRDGNRATIPAQKLPQGYEAPAFRVKLQDRP